MNRWRLESGLMVWMLMGLTVAVQAQTTYWLGTKDGDTLRFETQVPADAAAVIMQQKKAPGGGDDTIPRYRTFTHTIAGKAVRFHANEIGWETPKLQEGSLTWVVDSGMGADWRTCNPKNALWPDFADALKSLATDDGGWSSAKVVMAESTGKAVPTYKVNRDGSMGKPADATIAQWRLTDMNSKAGLTPDELDEVRDYLLDIANGGRANSNYRREARCKTALDLPRNLTPLALDATLNKAAQMQAEYCARVREATHDQEDPKLATLGLRLALLGWKEVAYEAAGGGGALADYPTGWMKSETHYRPWWNLDGQVVTGVGFGVAKGNDGKWYHVAVLGPSEPGPSNDAKPEPQDNAREMEPPANQSPNEPADAIQELKFTALKFFSTKGEFAWDKIVYGTQFEKNTLYELQVEVEFENPSATPFDLEVKSYFNGKPLRTESFRDLKDSGGFNSGISGNAGAAGTVPAGTYKAELRHNGKIVKTAQATVTG